MKVKDLIKKLQELDQDAEVILTSSNFELKGASVALSFVSQYNTGSKKEETFMDAFDYENYNKEVWSIIGGDIPVVLVS